MNLKTLGTLMAMVGAGMTFLAGSSSGNWAVALGTIGAGLTAAGAFVIGKAPAAQTPAAVDVMKAVSGCNGTPGNGQAQS